MNKLKKTETEKKKKRKQNRVINTENKQVVAREERDGGREK